MKTKLISLALALTLLTALILTGCGDNNQPNFGATGAKEYQPALSEMTVQEIRDRIDELYGKMINDYRPNDITPEYAVVIAVYQNELILRQLEALNADKDQRKGYDKQGLKGYQKIRLGLRGYGVKQGLKGN